MPLPIGSTYSLQLLITFGGIGVTGQSPLVTLQRHSDGFYWTGTAFTSTFTQVNLTQVDAARQPGLYSRDFAQVIDNVPAVYTAYYSNSTSPYQGASVEELVFANPVANVNQTAIASAVAAKILVNPAIPIDSSDIASQNLLLSVSGEVEEIEDNMALESTLLSGLNVIENDLNTIISIIQPISGSNEITFVFLDQNSLPIPGVKVTIKNTTNQITLATGITDINGQLILGLPTSSFSVLFFKSFISFPTQPYNLIVNGNATVIINCTSFQPTAPSPSLCAAYIYLIDAGGQPISNIMIRCKVVSNYPYSSGGSTLVTKDYQSVISDGTGFCRLNLIRGAFYEISAPALFLTITDYKVPDQATLDLSTLLGVSS